MKYLYFGLALFGLSAFAWAGVTLVRDRSTDTAVHASQASAAAETPLGGPIVHGLQLRFEIKNPTEGVSSHSFRVALVNVSDATIELRYRQSSEDTGYVMPYEAAMRHGVGFSSFPEIERDSFQTIGRFGDTFIDRAHRLLPGENIEIGWACDDERVAVPNGSLGKYAQLTPLTNGLFLVRAMLDVETADGGPLTIWSNECPFVVGGSTEAPKAHVAQVTPRYNEPSMYWISVGATESVEIGDVYRRGGYEYLREFTVRSMSPQGAIVEMSTPNARPGQPLPELPTGSQSVCLQWPASRASKTAIKWQAARAARALTPAQPPR